MAAPKLPPWPAGRPLRSWQADALNAVLHHDADSFLASATPAAGKTTFGLRVAWELLKRGDVERVVITAPTTHICRQWAADAARYGIDLEPNRPNADGVEPRDRRGVTVTYATVAAGPLVHRRATASRRTLLIADEPHHMGDDAAWGVTARQAFGDAQFKLLLSGTPFRTDDSPIPWVRYDDNGISASDYAYTYTDALLDQVCRPVTFLTYDGEMEWVSDGKTRRSTFGTVLPGPEAARRLRTALAPDGDWMGEVLRDAVRKLEEIRSGDHPDAGGLVVAMDKDHARRIAARLGRLTGTVPDVVHSDAPDASKRIGAFAASREPWLVSVLMVSEGVDIPRLRVGVYATAARTELFFRQVVGRFVRRTPAPEEQMAWVFMPSDSRLRVLAGTIEEERNHALDQREAAAEELDDGIDLQAAADKAAAGEKFEALSSSGYLDDGSILTTTQPGDALQLFGDPEPAITASPALAAFTAGASAAAPVSSSVADASAGFSRREALREERAKLVALVARRTGEPHRSVHARINRETGAKSVSAATISQLEKGNARLKREQERLAA